MIADVLADAKQRMAKSVEVFRRDLTSVRAGRATPALLDKVRVDYYGTPTPINQVASVTVPEARLIVIQPWDKTVLPAIERAILKSDLGLNPSSDGTLIRLAIPQLTEQRRQEIIRQIRAMAEDERVAIRNVRRDANDLIKQLEKDGDISSDDARRGSEEIQKLTDQAIAEIGVILAAKERELSEV